MHREGYGVARCTIDWPVHHSIILEMNADSYRAWHGGMCLSRHLKGRMLDVTYESLN